MRAGGGSTLPEGPRSRLPPPRRARVRRGRRGCSLSSGTWQPGGGRLHGAVVSLLCRASPTSGSAPADPAGCPRTCHVPSRPAVPWPPPGGAAWRLPTSPGLGIASDGPDSKAMAPMLISSLYRLFSSARKCVGPRNGDGSALSSLGRSTPGRSFL